MSLVKFEKTKVKIMNLISKFYYQELLLQKEYKQQRKVSIPNLLKKYKTQT